MEKRSYKPGLRIARETIRELAQADLAAAAGGTFGTNQCVTVLRSNCNTCLSILCPTALECFHAVSLAVTNCTCP